MEQWSAERAALDAQDAEQRRKKVALAEVKAEWKAQHQTLEQCKAQSMQRKKELADLNMVLKQEHLVLSEKEREVAEFHNSHRQMLKRLEQSIGRTLPE